MLLYKAWLETRWRFLMPLAMLLFVLLMGHSKGQLAPGPKSILTQLPFWWTLFPLVIAGSGITTEAPFRVMKGLHGSATFTLSLPVSRFRLFFSRALFGLTTTSGLIVAACIFAWLEFPELRVSVTTGDGISYIAAALICSYSVLGICTFFATFLDQQIRVLACLAVIVLPRMLVGWVNAPNFIDIFRVAGDASPIITHTMPWTLVFFCFAVGTAFLLAALGIVQRREY